MHCCGAGRGRLGGEDKDMQRGDTADEGGEGGGDQVHTGWTTIATTTAAAEKAAEKACYSSKKYIV